MSSSLFSDDGFTLAELLVVIFVMAILCAIALPAFAGRIDLGHDATTKSDTASLASLMEQCWVATEDYRDCSTQEELAGEPGGHIGLPVGNGLGMVQIVQSTQTTYRLRGRSHSGSSYRVFHPASGPQERTCTPPHQGGCPADGKW